MSLLIEMWDVSLKTTPPYKIWRPLLVLDNKNDKIKVDYAIRSEEMIPLKSSFSVTYDAKANTGLIHSTDWEKNIVIGVKPIYLICSSSPIDLTRGNERFLYRFSLLKTSSQMPTQTNPPF